MFLKDVIENKGGHKLFYINGEPVQREADLQILYRLTWFASTVNVSREVNDGRGPVDYLVSHGASDKTSIEFKLASNSKLEQNILKQVEVYNKASDAKKGYKVILYFTASELAKVEQILKRNNLVKSREIVLIDGRADNKPSGSKAK